MHVCRQRKVDIDRLTDSCIESSIMSKYKQFEDEDFSECKSENGTKPSAAVQIEDTQISVNPSLQVNFNNGNGADHQSVQTNIEGTPRAFINDPAGDRYCPKNKLEAVQLMVKRVVEHLIFRIMTVLLILTDFILVVVDLAIFDCDADSGLEITSHVIISYFMLEVALRIFYRGKSFFYNCIDVLDMVVVVVSFVTDMVFAGLYGIESCQKDNAADLAKLVVIGRVVRIIRICRIIYIMIVQHRHLTNATRQMVSQNKRRYQKDSFDLDLCYITERVIAMSFPSAGIMAFYRNPIHEVVRFFETKHKDHYKIYNLCSEKDYDESLFHNRVERIFIDDHNVPTLSAMSSFCENVREWMAVDKRNVIAVHCKGGKGRTGTIICTWLIDSGLFDEAKDVLDYFGDRRTDLSVGKMFQGVQTPSQSRYVGYYQKLRKDFGGKLPPKVKLRIVSIKITAIKGVGNGNGSDLSMEIRAEGLLIYECHLGASINCQVINYTDSDSIVINLQNSPALIGDVKIKFNSSSKKLPKGYDQCPFYFWFHTSFIENNKLYLSRVEIDNPHREKYWKYYRENFAICVMFEDAID